MYLNDGSTYQPGEGVERAKRLRVSGMDPAALEITVRQARESIEGYGDVPGATTDLFVADLILRGIVTDQQVAYTLLGVEQEGDAIAHRDDGQCHEACWAQAMAEHETAERTRTMPHKTSSNATPSPVDAMLIDDDPRHDPRLEDPAFIATDEGQALLAAAGKAADEERKLAKKAEQKALAQAAAKRKAEIEASTHSGPVEIVRPPINGKPTRAARKAGVKAPAATSPAQTARAPKAKAKAAPKAKVERAPKGAVSNKPLTLGNEPINVDGTWMYPILHRDGSIAEHQSHNYIWRCPTCKRRLRDEVCNGPTGDPNRVHKTVKAPEGYRAKDRLAL